MSGPLVVRPVTGIGEVTAGTDLAELVARHAGDLADGDVVVLTSKVVSKSEGRVVPAADRDQAIDAEAVRVLARRGATRIVETRHGLVLAAAGVDASNVPAGTVALLPVDPDASARRIRAGLRDRLGVDVAVVVTDTMGRPWRTGLVDVAIGAAGLRVLDDHRGRRDPAGRTLELTVTAIADEVAAAAELVKGKLAGVPVAVVRGLAGCVAADVVGGDDGPGAAALVRPAAEDMFRWGAREAVLAALAAPGPRASGDGVDPAVVDAAVAAVRAASGDAADADAATGAAADVAVEVRVSGGRVERVELTVDGDEFALGWQAQRLVAGLRAHGVAARVRRTGSGRASLECWPAPL